MQYLFCPACGDRYGAEALRGWNRTCGQCGKVFYLHSKPTASTLIVQDGRVLLGKRRVEPSKGKWDIIGGFLDYGEHPHAAAVREAEEETGLTVRIVRELGTFMDIYGDDAEATLNMAFIAEIVSGEMQPDDDIEELRWFAADKLPEDIAFENGRRMLEAWIRSL